MAEHWNQQALAGRPVPEGFADRPELTPHESFLWTAFHDLGTERQLGMGVGPIPWSVARQYAAAQGIDDEDGFSDFWAVIRLVDAEYVNQANKVDKNKKGGAGEGDDAKRAGPLTRSRAKAPKTKSQGKR